MTRTRFLFLAIAIVIGALHTFEVEAVDSVFGVPLPQSGHESIGANISNFCENLVSVCTCVAVSLRSPTTAMDSADCCSVHFAWNLSKDLGYGRSKIKDGPDSPSAKGRYRRAVDPG